MTTKRVEAQGRDDPSLAEWWRKPAEPSRVNLREAMGDLWAAYRSEPEGKGVVAVRKKCGKGGKKGGRRGR